MMGVAERRGARGNTPILSNLSAMREAPPTSAPSMSGQAMRVSTLSGATDPPY